MSHLAHLSLLKVKQPNNSQSNITRHPQLLVQEKGKCNINRGSSYEQYNFRILFLLHTIMNGMTGCEKEKKINSESEQYHTVHTTISLPDKDVQISQNDLSELCYCCILKSFLTTYIFITKHTCFLSFTIKTTVNFSKF